VVISPALVPNIYLCGGGDLFRSRPHVTGAVGGPCRRGNRGRQQVGLYHSVDDHQAADAVGGSGSEWAWTRGPK